jgi:lysophospholipase L1-like esterase
MLIDRAKRRAHSGSGWWLASFSACLALLPAVVAAAEPTTPLDALREARRIVFLGDSITYAGGWVANLAAWMEREGMTADVINMGLSSETVSGLSEEGHAGGQFPRPHLAERLDRVLRVARPDLVIACYGMNCGIYQPLDETRFAAFKEGMQRLHETVEKTGAKIIHLTPPVYDQRPDKPGPAGSVDYDAVLDAASTWLLSKRADGWLVIDVHGPMKEMLTAARAKDPSVVFAPDTVHPNETGHWAFCRAVLAGLGDKEAAAAETPAALKEFLPLVKQRMEILRDAYLSAAGHLRPGVRTGVPVGEAEATARVLTESIRSRRLHLMGRQREGSVEWKNPIEWPKPPVVDPGPEPISPIPPPGDAIVLFDGTSLDAWNNGGQWKVADGVATVGKGDIRTTQGFGDCQVHLEFRIPTDTNGKGQQRSNSGLFLMDNYEIQILDSFQDGTDKPVTYFDGQCGALYKQQPPAVNACRTPGKWQTYDVLFTRPRFHDDGTLATPGRVSVVHNGVAIHVDTVIKGNTFYHAPPSYTKHADALPLRLQDHGNPVQFRNIWVRPFEPLAPVPIDE